MARKRYRIEMAVSLLRQAEILHGRDRSMADMIELARRHGRHGYRRFTTLLFDAARQVSGILVERLWLNDRSCVRLRKKQVVL